MKNRIETLATSGKKIDIYASQVMYSTSWIILIDNNVFRHFELVPMFQFIVSVSLDIPILVKLAAAECTKAALTDPGWSVANVAFRMPW